MMKRVAKKRDALTPGHRMGGSRIYQGARVVMSPSALFLFNFLLQKIQ
jgi:hypothetical protein